MGAPRAALEAVEVVFAYASGRPVLRGVSLRADHGSLTMVLGLSGSGKTTLLKLCKGLLRPQRGTIDVLGGPVAGAARRGRLDPRVAYIPQQLGLVRSLSVMDNVLTGALSRVGTLPSLARLFPDDEVRRARTLLERLGLGAKAEEKVFALSGGERQRVAIARALMQGPQLLLADEFTSDLDPITGANILRIVREIAAEGVAVVITTHEMDVVEEHADHVIVLRHGEKTIDVRGRPDRDAIAAALRVP